MSSLGLYSGYYGNAIDALSIIDKAILSAESEAHKMAEEEFRSLEKLLTHILDPQSQQNLLSLSSPINKSPSVVNQENLRHLRQQVSECNLNKESVKTLEELAMLVDDERHVMFSKMNLRSAE